MEDRTVSDYQELKRLAESQQRNRIWVNGVEQAASHTVAVDAGVVLALIAEAEQLRAQAGCLQSACEAYREAAALANARAAREEQAYLAVCHDLDNANANLAQCRASLAGLLIPLNDTALRPETALMAIRDQVNAALEVNE
jgi:hypothetical protein